MYLIDVICSKLIKDWWRKYHHKFSLEEFFTYGKPNDDKMSLRVKLGDMEKVLEKRKQSWASLYPKGNIPIRVQNKLKFGVPKGRRNIACFGIGADLASQGFSKEEIMSLIQNSPILANDFTLSEAEKAVISGMKKITEGNL